MNLSINKIKYLKYKNKYLNLKNILGGDIKKNEILLLIESIGYEFESAYILPFHYKIISDEPIYGPSDLSKVNFDEVDFDAEDFNAREFENSHRKIIGFNTIYDENTLVKNIDKYNIKNYNEQNYNIDFILTKDTLSIDKIINDIDIYNLFNDENLTIQYKDNYININTPFKYDKYDETYKKNLNHCEFIFTFTNIKKSDNIIKETMQKSLDLLECYFKSLKYDYCNIKNVELGKHDNDYISVYKDTDIFYFLYSKYYQMTLADAKFVPQMTVGVKIENIEPLFLYFGKNNKQFYRFLLNIKEENKFIIDNFITDNKENPELKKDEKNINILNGFLFIINYLTNISLLNKKRGIYSYINENFPLLIRQTEKVLFNYIKSKMNSEPKENIYLFIKYIELFEKEIKEKNFKMYKKYILDNEREESENIINLNLFEHLKLYNPNINPKLVFVSSGVKTDYQIENDILLVENRMFVKDLTQIYDKQIKLSFNELKKIVESM